MLVATEVICCAPFNSLKHKALSIRAATSLPAEEEEVRNNIQRSPGRGWGQGRFDLSSYVLCGSYHDNPVGLRGPSRRVVSLCLTRSCDFLPACSSSSLATRVWLLLVSWEREAGKVGQCPTQAYICPFAVGKGIKPLL